MAELNFRKRGTKWEYRFEGASIEGKRNQISKGGFRTKAEASQAGTKALAEYNNAGFHFTPSEISVSDYLDYWSKEYCILNLKDTTCEGYEKKIKNHIKPALGKYKLKALTPAVLQAFINEKFNDGYSRNSLLVLKGILSGSLGYAVEPLGFIQSNPMLMVKLPSPRAKAEVPTRKKEKNIVTKEQINAIFERFPEGHSCHIPIQLAYRCGLRLGEAFALTWDDIDFENSKININKQIQDIEKLWTFTDPKYDSFRIIYADPVLMELLKRTKDKQIKAKEYYAELYKILYENGKRQLSTTIGGQERWMVNSREDGSYIQPRVTQHLGRIIHYQLGYEKFDYHSLRHTHATMLLENGANPVDIKERLGHTDIDMTFKYIHDTTKMKDKTRDILNEIYK